MHTGHTECGFNWCLDLKNVVFSFEKGSIGQNHSSSDSQHLIKSFPLPLNAIGETLGGG